MTGSTRPEAKGPRRTRVVAQGLLECIPPRVEDQPGDDIASGLAPASMSIMHPALTVLNMLTPYAFQNGSDHVNFAWSLSGFEPTLWTMFRMNRWPDLRTGSLHGRVFMSLYGINRIIIWEIQPIYEIYWT